MTSTRSATIVVLHSDSGDTGKPPATDRIEALGTVRYVTEDNLADALRDADVLLAWDFRSRAAAEAIAGADRLRWVHAASAGVNHLLSDEVLANEVLITNSRGVFDEPMAEYVLAMVLAMAKDLSTTVRLQHERRWHHRETETLGRRRALVAGTGPIGRAIARKLTAVGLTVTGLGRTAREQDPDLGTVLPTERLTEAVADADYVVLAAPLTDTTAGMVDAAALAAMKPTARLVNVGRGGLVVQDDLVAALRAGEIAGAALDVFAEEPLPDDSPLWTMPNVIVSPHMSGDVVGWRGELVALFVDNLTRYLDGRPLRNVVDKRHGYVREGAR